MNLLTFTSDFKLDFMSDSFRLWDMDEDELHTQKVQLLARVATKGKGKDQKPVYVIERHFLQDDVDCCDDFSFDKKEQALEHFYSERDWFNCLVERDRLDEVFDGRRYFWKVENGKVTEKTM